MTDERKSVQAAHEEDETDGERSATAGTGSAHGGRRSVLELLSTIADQGMWSLAGFVTTLAVGRVLGAEELGAFAVGLSVLYGIGGFCTSLVMEPSAVMGPAHFPHQTRRYAGALIAGSAIALAPLIPVGVAVALASNNQVATAMGAALATTPPVMTAWAARRCVYLTADSRVAGVGSAVYLVGMLGGLALLYVSGSFTVPMVFLVMAVAALLQVAVISAAWRPQWSGVLDAHLRGRITSHHWTFGKWLLAANSASWVVQYGYGAMIAVVVSLAEAGGFRAAQNLQNSVGLVYIALAFLYTPKLTAEVHRSGAKHLMPRVRSLSVGMSAVALLLFVPTVVVGDEIMALLYGAEFADLGWVLAAMAALVVLSAPTFAVTIGLRALENSKALFHGQIVGAATALTIGFAAGAYFGLGGVVAALFVGTVLRLLILVRALRAGIDTGATGEAAPA